MAAKLKSFDEVMEAAFNEAEVKSVYETLEAVQNAAMLEVVARPGRCDHGALNEGVFVVVV